MKKLLVYFAAALLAVGTICGCATVTPVSSIVYATPAGSSAGVVKQGIINAAKENGWDLQQHGDRTYLVTKSSTDFTATSKIVYSASQYEISYVNSSIKAEDGKVPPAYNEWVTELNKAIQNAIIKLRNPAVAASERPQTPAKNKPKAKKSKKK